MANYYETNKDGITEKEINEYINSELSFLKEEYKKILLVVPDYTRLPSKSGEIVKAIFKALPNANIKILVACGTHMPIDDEQISLQYPGIDHNLFTFHNWRKNTVKVGEIPKDFIKETTDNLWEEKNRCIFRFIII